MVYTNLTSEVNIKSLLNNPEDTYFDSSNVSDNINIVTNMIAFKETGLNKTVKVERIFGDTVVTTIERPTHTDIDITLMIDEDIISDSTTVYDIMNQLGDMTSNDGYDDYEKYSETDVKRRHRIALNWNDITNTYMKVFYNAYVVSSNMTKDDLLQINFKLRVPIMDIQTGKPNYYEYEGIDASDILSTLDTAMSWD